MAKLLKLRRGTTVQHGSFTGAEGEVTVDTTKDTAVVHDGTTAGGKPLATETAVALKAPLASPAFTGSPSITLGSDATGDVYYRAAGGALTRLATGADGTVLTSTGAAAVPAFEALPASGGLTHLATANLSGSTNTGSTFRNLFTSTYQSYWIVMRSMAITTDAGEIRMVFSSDASTNLTGSNYQIIAQGRGDEGTVTGWSYADQAHLELNTNQGNATGETHNFTGTINGTQDSNAYSNMHGTGTKHGGAADYLFGFQMACEYEVAATTVTGVYLYAEAGGNFDGGSVTIFGIKES